MSESVEIGPSLWPAIALGIYWACLLLWNARHSEGTGGFLSGLPPPVAGRDYETGPVPAGQDNGGNAEPTRADFLHRVSKAYEFILLSFAAGNVRDLAELVSPDVLAEFSREIRRRQAAGESMALNFVSVEPAIMEWNEDENGIEATVRFVAEILISEEVGGKAGDRRTTIVAARDIWTFRREHLSRSPIWTLVATDCE